MPGLKLPSERKKGECSWGNCREKPVCSFSGKTIHLCHEHRKRKDELIKDLRERFKDEKKFREEHRKTGSGFSYMDFGVRKTGRPTGSIMAKLRRR